MSPLILHGHRIGYGKGYYDRFLQHPGRTAHLVGLCHDFQLIDGAIPAEEHDIRMELIVTDRRIIHVETVEAEVTGATLMARIYIEEVIDMGILSGL